MILRLLLAAALLAPQASGAAHALEVARLEAAHPHCAHAPDADGAEPARSHDHHDEGSCRQCPRPPQAQGAAAARGDALPASVPLPDRWCLAPAPAAGPPPPARGPPVL